MGETESNIRDTVAVGQLSFRVGALENDVRGLSTKIDNVATSLHQAVEGLSKSLSDRNKTPWGTVFAGLMVLVTVLGLLVNSYLSPLAARITDNEASIHRIDQQRYDEMSRELNRYRDRDQK